MYEESSSGEKFFTVLYIASQRGFRLSRFIEREGKSLALDPGERVDEVSFLHHLCPHHNGLGYLTENHLAIIEKIIADEKFKESIQSADEEALGQILAVACIHKKIDLLWEHCQNLTLQEA